MAHSFDVVCDNRISRSIIWILCRCLPEPVNYPEESMIRHTSFVSEFHAGQVPWSIDPLFDYSALAKTKGEWVPTWQLPMKKYAINFQTRLRRVGYLFPKVQRKKNTTRETAYNYHEYLQVEPTMSQLSAVTSLDLEKLYHKTGIQIQGSNEMRSAWKFGDLKPRYYYCMGGTEYWASRYMKRFAVLLMESIPSCTVRMRTSPQEDLIPDDDDYISTWDFKAFTTRLSDLRYMLYHLARGLEKEEIYVSIVDYRLGLLRVPSWELLDQYNKLININAPYDIERIRESASYFDNEAIRVFYQQNSGMLGVPGNIGFSTANHGLIVSMAVDETKGCCVGDDGLRLGKTPFAESALCEDLQLLGVMHPEKDGELAPDNPGPLRFVKRGWYRPDTLGDFRLFRDFLFDLPIPSIIDGEYGNRDIFPLPSKYERARKVGTAAGGVLWQIHEHRYEISDQEIILLEIYLRLAYHKVGLSPIGGLPGKFLKQHGTISFAYPCIDFDRYDPRWYEWLDFQFEQIHQTSFSIPLDTPKAWKMPFGRKGDVVYWGRNKFVKVFEDIEVVESTVLYENVTFLSEVNRRRVRQHLMGISSGLDPMCKVVFLKDIPDEFLFLVDSPYDRGNSLVDYEL